MADRNSTSIIEGLFTELGIQEYESALRDVGLDVTSVGVEQASRIIGQRPTEVQLAIIMALDRCATWSKTDWPIT